MHCSRWKRRFGLLAGLFLVAGIGLDFTSPAASAKSDDPALENLLENVENKYNRLKTARLKFRQIYREGNRTVREEAGTLYLSKPGQMRWEYENPEPKLFLSDGKKLILYVPAENRVMESAVKESDDLRTPLRFLLGRLRFEKEFEHIGPAEEFPALEEGNVMVKAVPKRMGDQMEWVVFEVTAQYEIRRLIVFETGGIQTEFRFEDAEPNPPLARELFRFRPPPGTEIIQQ